MEKKTTRTEATKKATKVNATMRKCSLSMILLVVTLIGISLFTTKVIEEAKHQQKENQHESQQEVTYVAYSNIRRKIKNDEKRELQQMLREMSYIEIIPSIGYKKFDRFMCKLYTYESERGTVEILINPKREAIILLRKDDNVQVIDSINNIDYKIEKGLPEASIVFHEATWIADENGMNKWKFGKKELVVEESFKKYENTTLSILKDTIIVSSGKRLLAINEKVCTELLTDCKDGQYKFFNQSLFYINPSCELLEKNLITGEEILIDNEVYQIKGEVRVRYKVINELDDKFILGYIDQEGNRRRFEDFEIDENLNISVN